MGVRLLNNQSTCHAGDAWLLRDYQFSSVNRTCLAPVYLAFVITQFGFRSTARHIILFCLVVLILENLALNLLYVVLTPHIVLIFFRLDDA